MQSGWGEYLYHQYIMYCTLRRNIFHVFYYGIELNKFGCTMELLVKMKSDVAVRHGPKWLSTNQKRSITRFKVPIMDRYGVRWRRPKEKKRHHYKYKEQNTLQAIGQQHCYSFPDKRNQSAK
jgi:hypothetical protein